MIDILATFGIIAEERRAESCKIPSNKGIPELFVELPACRKNEQMPRAMLSSGVHDAK